MDFPFLLFKSLFLPLKAVMEIQRKFRERRLRTCPDVVKTSYSNADHPECQCNLYRSKEKNDGSLIIDIHGGCWIHGDKDVYDCWNSQMASQGHTVSTLTYRTADKVSMKEQIQDVFAYLHYLYDHRDLLGISFDQAMLTGDSAGAQLSLLTIAINQSESLQKIFEVEPVDIEFQALALTHSVCFVDQAASVLSSQKLNEAVAVPGLLKLLYGNQFEKDPVYQNSSSPQQYLKPGMKLPRILLVTSAGDRHFNRHTFRLAEYFDSAGIEYSLYAETDKKATHVFNIVHPFSSAAKACNQAIADFFSPQAACQC